MKITTQAVVLRDYKAQENRVLILLTKDEGVLTAFANGAHKTKSKFSGSTELLCYSDFVLFKSRDNYYVDSSDLISSFYGIRKSIEKLALASYFAELAGELAPKGENAESFLRLFLNCIYFLEKDKYPPLHLKSVFEMRILTMAGYMPDLIACSSCAGDENKTMLFSPKHGNLLCGNCINCIGENHSTQYIKLKPGILAALRYIIYSPFDKLFKFSVNADTLHTINIICEQYIKYQLEKTFTSLEFYNNLTVRD